MGIILGYISLICFCLLAVKWITRKLHLEKVDKFLMRIHKKVGATFLVACVLHIALAVPVFKTRSIYVLITGSMVVAAVILLIIFCHVMKNNAIKLRWHRIFTTVILIFIICHMIAYFIDFANYQKKIKEIHIQNIDVSEVEDGTYTGEYDAGYIYAKVEVTVADGKITELRILEHDNERGEKAEIITEKMLEEQKIDVDAVTGATNSSKVIKMAVQNALFTGTDITDGHSQQ